MLLEVTIIEARGKRDFSNPKRYCSNILLCWKNNHGDPSLPLRHCKLYLSPLKEITMNIIMPVQEPSLPPT